MPAEFTVTGSPITTNGTLRLPKQTKRFIQFSQASTGVRSTYFSVTFASTELSDTANITYDNVANVFTANQTLPILSWTAATTATTATAEHRSSANPAAFLQLSINGTAYKLPLTIYNMPLHKLQTEFSKITKVTHSAQGWLVCTLSHDSTYAVFSVRAVTAGIRTKIFLDNNGNVAGTQYLWLIPIFSCF